MTNKNLTHTALVGWMVLFLTLGTAGSAHANSENSSTSSMYIVYKNQMNEEEINVTAELMLSTNNIKLNAFEVELHFRPEIHRISDVTLHRGLCEPAFVVTKEVDVDNGIIYVACGTSTPFITGVEFMPILSVAMVSEDILQTQFQFGPRTSFRIHDGFGTPANVQVLTDLIVNDSPERS